MHDHVTSIAVKDLNLPLSGISLILVAFFFRLKTPREPFKEKIRRMDWM
jgi:hypothetical protein